MKFFLKRLFHNNKNYFEVWNYLWIMSNTKHEIVFQYLDVSSELKISKSTITRAMKIIDDVNNDKVYIELKKLENNEYYIKFYPNGKTYTKNESDLNKKLMSFLQAYYKENDIHYPELSRHNSHIKKIVTKLSLLMVKRKVELNETNVENTFQIFFKNIPTWWKQNQFTLPSVNKNFTKILNQIKSNNKNNTKYDKTSDEVSNLKFK